MDLLVGEVAMQSILVGEVAMQSIIVALLAIPLALNLGAERRLNLDAPTSVQIRVTHPSVLERCNWIVMIPQIGSALDIPVGIENSRDCWLLWRGKSAAGPEQTLDLTGMSIRQAFERLMTSMPGFSWRELNGVIVVRPNTAWTDPRNVLNLPTAAFETRDQPLDNAIHAVLNSVTPKLFVPQERVPRPEGPIDQRISVSFRGGTMLEAINEIARARGKVYWQFGYDSVPNQALIEFGILDAASLVLTYVAVPDGR
jgi:hypothetical protein